MEEKRKKLSMVVLSGDMDKLIAAFIIATGAAASNMDVTMFFTFWGVRAIKKPVNTGKSFFGKMIGLMYGGDLRKAGPSKFNFYGLGRWMFGKMMASKGVMNLVEFRKLAVELGVKMYPCSMSMDIMEIRQSDFIDEAEKEVGVAFFISEALESQITLFI
jgi:peroxiredoxin family protein